MLRVIRRVVLTTTFFSVSLVVLFQAVAANNKVCLDAIESRPFFPISICGYSDAGGIPACISQYCDGVQLYSFWIDGACSPVEGSNCNELRVDVPTRLFYSLCEITYP